MPDPEAAKDEGFLDLMELADILPGKGSHELKLVVRDNTGSDIVLLLNYREEGQ